MLSAEAVVERGVAVGVCLGNAGKGGEGPSSQNGDCPASCETNLMVLIALQSLKEVLNQDLTDQPHDEPEMGLARY